ncbi:MAG: sulfatase-like hydrolase/transferase [Candidatus Cyclobacteriaceae bacterium M3_2C_046]
MKYFEHFYPRYLIICLFFLFASGVSQGQDLPNILFIFSDDQRADAVGAYGNPYIQTPHLDKLAHQGLKFTNNFCMGSHHGAVCAPSRAMLMSGKSLFHVYDDLEGVTTLPQVLGEKGYVTFGTGKWHNGRNTFKTAFQKGKTIFFGGMSDHFQVPVVDMKPDGSYTETTKEGFSTTIFTDAALEFLDQYANGAKDQPFFAYVSYTVPHDPRSPDLEYINRYEASSLPLPPDFKTTHPFDIGVMTIRDENLGAWPRTPEQIRMQLADYYGLITQMDDEIGRLLQKLKQEGLDQNTLIIFSSDHGLAIGSHGLLGKQNLYEHSMKSPLIMSGPGIPAGESSQALVYLYDLFPTICEYLQIEKPASVDGLSLIPVIKGERKEVRNSLFTTYATFQRAVRDQRWKLIRYPELNFTQLFDLKKDPYELHNLAGQAEYQEKVEEMMQLLKQCQAQSGDDLPLTAANTKDGKYDLSEYDRQPDQHQPDYTLKKYFGR